MSAENPHAGKGSAVLLDIGGDVGALVIAAPADLADKEIELRPAGRKHDDHQHRDGAEHGHGHGHGQLPHVAVVPRPSPDGGTIYSAVFYEVPQGSYELYVRPAGPVQLTVDVTGGEVAHATWPS